MLNNKAPGPALRTPYGPGADPLATVTKEQVLMGHATDQCPVQPTPAQPEPPRAPLPPVCHQLIAKLNAALHPAATR